MSETMRLWELGDALRDVLHDSHFDEETGALQPEWEERLCQAESDIKSKALSCAAISREWSLSAKALREQAKVLADRARALEGKKSWILGYVQRELQHADLDTSTIEDDRVSIRWRRSASVEVYDVSALPEEYVKREVKPLRVDILRDLRDDKAIPGVKIAWRRSMSVR